MGQDYFCTTNSSKLLTRWPTTDVIYVNERIFLAPSLSHEKYQLVMSLPLLLSLPSLDLLSRRVLPVLGQNHHRDYANALTVWRAVSQTSGPLSDSFVLQAKKQPVSETHKVPRYEEGIQALFLCWTLIFTFVSQTLLT